MCSTPDRQPIIKFTGEATSRIKAKFFLLLDTKEPHKSRRQLFKDIGIANTTANRWIAERTRHCSPAVRRIGKHRRGPPEIIPNDILDMLLDHGRNPVRRLPLPMQMAYHNIDCHLRTLQRALWIRKNNARMYRCAVVSDLSESQCNTRIEYGNLHKDKTVEDFWQYIYFTDECHIDPSQWAHEQVLREEGTRLEPENLQEVPSSLKGCKVHCAAFVNWHKIGPLQFYNDEKAEPIMEVRQDPKPRRHPKHGNEEEYQQRLREWEANLPKKPDVKVPGNLMTQAYYTDKLLPGYVNAIRDAQIKGREHAILQEDNDPSHGTRSLNNVAAKLKKDKNIELLKHPANSPDLNPIEACWNILKQCIKRRFWRNLDEFRRIVLEEWSRIKIGEVRARISEMQWRCQQLTTNGGSRIKSDLW